MRKPKNYGQKWLSEVEGQLEATHQNGMPPLEAVKTECAIRGLTDQDAEQIYDSWLASGFRLKGGNRIKDWRANIRTWQRYDLFLSQKKARANLNAMEQRQEERRAAAIRRMKDGR